MERRWQDRRDLLDQNRDNFKNGVQIAVADPEMISRLKGDLDFIRQKRKDHLRDLDRFEVQAGIENSTTFKPV